MSHILADEAKSIADPDFDFLGNLRPGDGKRQEKLRES